ncbi:alpha-isopropylmalate synthase regulatory domain-containing protein [Reichenbachiella sp. MALMAid0571]|uniref:alpha-isopropylmalate synthase regulatory domain-containing protein n=1 Tax=Reichenbachiella sp. MALMAid0571 TaxID=3143939 RepID=UPI0032DE2D9C
MAIEILDTTLRDGEQTSGVSFTEGEKLSIAQLLLEELKVDRIEVASARVSDGEYAGARKIFDWAKQNGYLNRVEVLGFVDGDISLKWIQDAGGKVDNLLCKGSLKHCEKQLRKTPEEHLNDIKNTIAIADDMGIEVNIYLEDWSNGMIDSPEYVYQIIEGLSETSVKRIMLPDTLGILNHRDTGRFCEDMVNRFPNMKFDYHAHNDYDLSTANAFEAIKAGVHGIHTTLNGLGERAGNVPLSSVIGVVKDHLKMDLNIDEKKLYKVSKVVESFSGVRIPQNKPLIGEFVFTQTSGIHADGDSKDNLYQTALEPARFGRTYTYALGKMSGKSSIQKNLDELGIELSKEETKKLTQRIIELGDKKESITKEDLPFIIKDVLGTLVVESKVQIKNYSLSVAQGLKSMATLSVEIDGKLYEQTASGDGQYDAFMNSLGEIYDQLERQLPRLVDYEVHIPPGGNTDALVITTITWENGQKFKTRGLDPDQTVAAIKATIKMLNIIENKK